MMSVQDKSPLKRILVSDSIAPEGIEILEKIPGFGVDVRTKLSPQELLEVIGDYDALVIRSATKVTREVIARAQRLSIIGRAGTGLDNVDMEAASIRGIVVMNTPGGNTITTAEHAIAMMVSLARRIPQATASMKTGKWDKTRFTGNELYNKTLGIIGIGRVGSVVADRAQGLKMDVLAYDPFISPDAAAKMGITLVSLEEIFARSDYISVHAPLTDETRGIVNAAAFGKMKRGVYLINCARGGIIKEKDLHDALASGQVAGAALDVFEEEPTRNHELLSLENLICTPHLGASTDEAQVNVAIAIAEQISDYLRTGEIRNALNFPSVSAEVLNLIQPYLVLAEKLGLFEAQVVAGAIKEVTIEYSGEILAHNLAPITIALLKGLLTPVLREGINYINAPLVARERGINVVEVKSTELKAYTSLISLTVKTAREEGSAAGTIFGRNDPRIVKVNRFTVEIIPEGHMLLLSNFDRPGVVGNVGTILGDNQINIAQLHLSRQLVDQQALVVLSTDSLVPDEVMGKLKEIPHVVTVKRLKM
ncbi:MAG: phosphoglycerate dehydrogenase [Smithellaceae bacterium]|nr:phosphoglycerate dehydrogenase [Smithellaceae bacterium]